MHKYLAAHLEDDHLWQELVPGCCNRGPLGMLLALPCTFQPIALRNQSSSPLPLNRVLLIASIAVISYQTVTEDAGEHSAVFLSVYDHTIQCCVFNLLSRSHRTQQFVLPMASQGDIR